MIQVKNLEIQIINRLGIATIASVLCMSDYITGIIYYKDVARLNIRSHETDLDVYCNCLI